MRCSLDETMLKEVEEDLQLPRHVTQDQRMIQARVYHSAKYGAPVTPLDLSSRIGATHEP